ncbi:MAG: GNAT family acetyltransferase [Pseudomonadota bacterium]
MPPLPQIAFRTATVDDQSAVVTLWRACDLVVPHNRPETGFHRAVTSAQSDVLVASVSGEIVGSAMVGDDGHRGWIYYLAVHPRCEKQGIGRSLCNKAERWGHQRGLRKIQLMTRPANENVRRFYERCDYEETPRLVMAKWLDKKAAT